MTEEKIGRLRDVFLNEMKKFFVEQDKFKELEGKPEKEKVVGFLGIIMTIDSIFQTVCELGISGARIRKVSSEEIENTMKEFTETSKELRRYMAEGKIQIALFHLSQFQLLQRKVLRIVANLLSPNPLNEFSKLEATPIVSKNIFVVHGRDDKPKLELARMLEKIGFNVIILSEQPDKGRTIIEKLEEETMNAGYAFIVLTPDDLGGLSEDIQQAIVAFQNRNDIKAEETRKIFDCLTRRARQNVILELGYFVGKIGRNRVCCLHKGTMELPSDVHGVVFKKFEKSVEECYKGIIEELKAVGFELREDKT